MSRYGSMIRVDKLGAITALYQSALEMLRAMRGDFGPTPTAEQQAQLTEVETVVAEIKADMTAEWHRLHRTL